MRLVAASLLLLLAAPAPAAEDLSSEEEKTLYAMGLVASRSFRDLALSPRELEIVKRGLTDALTGRKPLVEITAYEGKVQELARRRLAEASKRFLDVAAREKAARKSESGLVYVPIREGSGRSPTASDTVKVHYEGRFPDGKVFDSSYRRGAPAEFPLSGVIKCWTEGLQMMKPGGKAKLVCPASIAYGDAGHPPLIPGGATLVFEVELLEVKK